MFETKKLLTKGENELRRLYSNLDGDDGKTLSYTIIRPGGLTMDPPVGFTGVGISQGDEMSGRISRWDVASLCLESIDSPSAFDTTFECYNADTAKTLNEVGFSNIFKLKNEAAPEVKRASSWGDLFRLLKRDPL